MEQKPYQQTLAEFEGIVRSKTKDRTMVALIVDSPWLPGYAGVSTLDFYFDRQCWLDVYFKVLEDLPGVAFMPGAWVEFGMAAEPSGWGASIQWSSDSPPAISHCPGGLPALLEADVPDPETDGLMPVILKQYESVIPALEPKGLAPRMAAARGPLAVASHLLGVTEMLLATKTKPGNCLCLLEKTTDLCIRWLQCQLKRMDNPIGVLVLDDVVGMLSPDDAEKFALPFLRRIFDSFPDLIHIYHNDTPNESVFRGLSTIGMDVFNFSHEIDVELARELLGPDIVLMGNVPPLDVLVRGSTNEVRRAAQDLLQKVADFGPLVISAGGGVSPGTPIENLQVMVEVVNAG
ncbi:MAG: uroporphyrinogen decarboxylase [Planctomycetota bacterium]|nr:MAG: uroporphyrinogen decarboxylase [Planctomycetota bacterium]